MGDPEAGRRERAAERLEGWLGAALVLPALAVAWPGPGGLAGDPGPLATSGGIVLLALLPAAALLALRGSRLAPRLPLLLALPVASGLLAVSAGRVADTRAAWSAALLGASALVALGAGAALGPRGRETLARGLTLATLALLVPAFVASPGPAFVGVLGNTGTLSQVALPGAAAGAWLAATGRGPWRVLGAVAVLLFIAHAGTAPVLAGALALAAAMSASALLSPWARRRRPIKRAFGLLAALTIFALIAARQELVGAGASAAPAGVAEEPPAPRLVDRLRGGGIEVRARIWVRVPALAAEAPLLGVGPGQFAARFPPHRDPAEIEVSTHGRTSGAESLVEHPHNDWLLGAVEWGAAGGLAWVLFLALSGAAALRGLALRDLSVAPVAAAALAMLVGALFHCPLLSNPAAAAAGFGLLGAALAARADEGGEDAPATAPRRSRLPGLLAIGLVLALAPEALRTVRHGRALSDALDRLEELEASLALGFAAPEAAFDAAREAVDAALDACPDSVRAQALLARMHEATGDGEAALASWAAVLARRPHDLEALQQTAVAHARAGRWEEARAEWERARALDPAHPLVLRNLAQLELNAGRPEVALRRYLELRAAGRLDAAAARRAAADELLAGRQAAGLLLLTELPELRAGAAPTTPEELWAEAAAQREQRRERWADALACAAQRGWAWEHAAAEDPEATVRSLRQALAYSRRHVTGGAPPIRWELAAALSLTSRVSEARELALELGPTEPGELADVAEWARVELESAGLVP